jgi:TPR repeat protein
MFGNGQGVEQSYEKAVEYYTMAAEQGHPCGQCILGSMFYNGQGVEQSYEKAVEYYTMAAEQGHPVAQCNLGNMFYRGKGLLSTKGGNKDNLIINI